MVCDPGVSPIVPSRSLVVPGFTFPVSGSLGTFGSPPSQPGSSPDHRYYDQLRLPEARLGVLRFSLSSSDTLYALLCLFPLSHFKGSSQGRDHIPVKRREVVFGLTGPPHLAGRLQGNNWSSQVPELPLWTRAMV